MRKATRIIASITGVIAGLAGIEHGIFEFLQRGSSAKAWMFASMGSPCNQEINWSACEPAMSVLPDFLTMSILTMLLGLILCLWSAIFIHRKGGGWITIFISILMLLFGGGFFPPVIGMVSGFVATAIQKPVDSRKINGFNRFAAKLWPWPFIYFLLWGFGQFFIGYYFNTFLKANMLIFTLLFLISLPISIFSAYSHDLVINTSKSDFNQNKEGLK